MFGISTESFLPLDKDFSFNYNIGRIRCIQSPITVWLTYKLAQQSLKSYKFYKGLSNDMDLCSNYPYSQLFLIL